MQHIYCEIKAPNVYLLEELVDMSLVNGIIVSAKKGFEVAGDDILELSSSVWEVTFVLNSLLEENIDKLIASIIELASSLKMEILLIERREDNENYSSVEITPPLKIGNFIICSTEEDFIKEQKYSKLIPIMVKQSTAFGTGKHETTAMCLLALQYLRESNVEIKEALDLGTGTAILALAMVKLWSEVNVLATDIDELAINTAVGFVNINNQESRISLLLSNGFENIKREINTTKYDLITANILLQPLLNMIDDFYANLKHGGYIVLSGFLEKQANQLRKAYLNKGFMIEKDLNKDDWQAIIFKKQ